MNLLGIAILIFFMPSIYVAYKNNICRYIGRKVGVL